MKLGAAKEAAFVALVVTIEGVEIKELLPTIVKKVVSGYGLADKGLVASRVMMILGKRCPAVEKDAANVLAIAICGSRLCHKLISQAA